MLQKFWKLDSLKSPNNSWIDFIAVSMCTFLFCDNLLAEFIAWAPAVPGLAFRTESSYWCGCHGAELWGMMGDGPPVAGARPTAVPAFATTYLGSQPWLPPQGPVTSWTALSLYCSPVYTFSAHVHPSLSHKTSLKKNPYSVIKLLIILRKQL